jgi:hypothetical protein
MKKLLLKLLRAVKSLRLARSQQASEKEISDNVLQRLLANREVNLFFFVVQIKQFNAILEEGTNINFAKTDDDDD